MDVFKLINNHALFDLFIIIVDQYSFLTSYEQSQEHDRSVHDQQFEAKTVSVKELLGEPAEQVGENRG